MAISSPPTRRNSTSASPGGAGMGGGMGAMGSGMAGPTAVDVEMELCTIRSNTSHEQLFPTFYRRGGGGTLGGGRGGVGVPMVTMFSSSSTSSAAVAAVTEKGGGSIGGGAGGGAAGSRDRVVYAPMAEQKKLGYFSTAALIIRFVLYTIGRGRAGLTSSLCTAKSLEPEFL